MYAMRHRHRVTHRFEFSGLERPAPVVNIPAIHPVAAYYCVEAVALGEPLPK